MAIFKIVLFLLLLACTSRGRRMQNSIEDRIREGATGSVTPLKRFALVLHELHAGAAFNSYAAGVSSPVGNRRLAGLHGKVSDQQHRLGRQAHVMNEFVIEDASVPSNVTMTSEQPSLAARVGDAADAVYRFSRPHTIRGTLLACFTGVGRAIMETPSFLSMLPGLMPMALRGVAALLLGNLFIVGINQIYDVKIDKTNKPFLPVAAGRISPRTAWWLVLASGAAGLAIVRATFDNLIFSLYAFGTLIGGLYSVPPFQLKRFPLAAGLTIATCRGFLLNFGVYYAAREAVGLPFVWSEPVNFLARFMTVYAAVIAVTKDLPDVQGDREGGIDTFASRLGPKVVARGATAVLLLNYAGAIATALAAAPGAFHKTLMATGHALAAAWLWRAHTQLDTTSMQSIKQYYKQIWNCFYFEYMMYPFI